MFKFNGNISEYVSNSVQLESGLYVVDFSWNLKKLGRGFEPYISISFSHVSPPENFPGDYFGFGAVCNMLGAKNQKEGNIRDTARLQYSDKYVIQIRIEEMGKKFFRDVVELAAVSEWSLQITAA